MGDIDHDLGFVLNQRRRKRAPFTGPQEAEVISADAAGVRFKIPSFHPNWAFGPARWTHPSGGSDYPPAGTRCLVAFSGDDLTAPWVVALDGWAPGGSGGPDAPGYTDEQARDAVAAALVAGPGVKLTVDDAANTITITTTGDGGVVGMDIAITGAGQMISPPPGSPRNGQLFKVRALATGGDWAVTFDPAFRLSSTVTSSVVTIPNGQVLIAEAEYAALSSAWVLTRVEVSSGTGTSGPGGDPGGGGTPPPGDGLGAATIAGRATVTAGAVGATPPGGGGGGPAAAPTVSAGDDVSLLVGAPFNRVATITDNGAAIASTAWTIVSGPLGAGTTIGTAASLAWTAGSTPSGSFDIRHPLFQELAYEITSTAENSTLNWQSAYRYIQDINDGRGYTGGLIGFCSGTGDMEVMLQHYSAISPGNALEKFLPKFAQISAAAYADRPALSHSLLDPMGFVAAWQSEADNKPLFRLAQRDERTRVYWKDALAGALADGVGPLGLVLHYDVLVNHGPGGDSQSYGGIISAARSSSSKPPSQGGDEAAYLLKICDLRDAVLKQWGDYQANGRSGIHRGLIAAGKLTLVPPFTWSVYGDTYTINSRPSVPNDVIVGDYKVRITATNSAGSGSDDVTVTVS